MVWKTIVLSSDDAIIFDFATEQTKRKPKLRNREETVQRHPSNPKFVPNNPDSAPIIFVSLPEGKAETFEHLSLFPHDFSVDHSSQLRECDCGGNIEVHHGVGAHSGGPSGRPGQYHVHTMPSEKSETIIQKDNFEQ